MIPGKRQALFAAFPFLYSASMAGMIFEQLIVIFIFWQRSYP
jgi:cytochrome bd-type quinol oxidase subunit 2